MTKKQLRLEVITVTPKKAMELLENNKHNRPIRQVHVQAIANDIKEGRWLFNGDTIKLDIDGEIADGQHRLWAIIEAGLPVQTAIAYDVPKEAYAKIDTNRCLRTGADVLAHMDVARYRPTISMALTWLLRYQRGILETYKDPKNRIKLVDIEEAFRNHPGMIHAAELGHRLRNVINPSVCAFLYYIFNNHNPELAERFATILEEPKVSINDPFFRLRVYLTGSHPKRLDPVMTLALAIKAANATFEGRKVSQLVWRYQAKNPEPFPVLAISTARRVQAA